MKSVIGDYKPEEDAPKATKEAAGKSTGSTSRKAATPGASRKTAASGKGRKAARRR